MIKIIIIIIVGAWVVLYTYIVARRYAKERNVH